MTDLGLVLAIIIGTAYLSWCWSALIADEREDNSPNEEPRPAVEVAMAADPDGDTAEGSCGSSTYPTGAGSSPKRDGFGAMP